MVTRSSLAYVTILTLACSACGDGTPVPPTASAAMATTPAAPAPTPTGPTFAGPARVFGNAQPLSYPISEWTRQSRYSLYANGSFTLLSAVGSGGYHGTYEERDGIVTFHWDATSVIGAWGATGRLSGDRMTVRYNEVMLLTDFEDAVYTATQ